MVDDAYLAALFADAAAFIQSFHSAELAASGLACSTIFKQHAFDGDRLLSTFNTVAETFQDEFLVLDAYFFIAGCASEISRLILNPIVLYGALRFALRANYMVRCICIVSHAFQIFLYNCCRHERHVDSRIDDTLQAIVGVVPVESVEL